MRLLAFLFLLVPEPLFAIQQSGSVRAADQFIPGATITARQGGAKVAAYTDEAGRILGASPPSTGDGNTNGN